MALVERFLWPPRPSEAVPFEAALSQYENQPSYVGQHKYNDSRCLIWFREGTGEIQLWNRKKERGLLDYSPTPGILLGIKKLAEALGLKPGLWHALDGGILHTRHKFPWAKDKLVVYDVLARDGRTLLGTKRSDRHHWLLSAAMANLGSCPVMIPMPDDSGLLTGQWVEEGSVFVPQDFKHSEWALQWELINKLNAPWISGTGSGEVSPILEGLVIKDNSGTLEPMTKEANNSAWMCRTRVRTGRHAF